MSEQNFLVDFTLLSELSDSLAELFFSFTILLYPSFYNDTFSVPVVPPPYSFFLSTCPSPTCSLSRFFFRPRVFKRPKDEDPEEDERDLGGSEDDGDGKEEGERDDGEDARDDDGVEAGENEVVESTEERRRENDRVDNPSSILGVTSLAGLTDLPSFSFDGDMRRTV